MDKKIPVSEVNWSTSVSHQCAEDIPVEQELLQPVYAMIVNVCQRNIRKKTGIRFLIVVQIFPPYPTPTANWTRIVYPALSLFIISF